VTRLDPCAGESGVVNKADLGEPAKNRVRDIVGNAALDEDIAELGAGLGGERQLLKADLACALFWIELLFI
jgi:hypothetical protein